MDIEIKIDSSCLEPKIVVITAVLDEKVNHLIKSLSQANSLIIAGYKNDKVEILDPLKIIRIYANSKKIFADTVNGEYLLKLKLYELQERLPTIQFVRISNSEIINLKHVNNFDLSLSGTICVKLNHNITTYVSRRYVPKLKQILGI